MKAHEGCVQPPAALASRESVRTRSGHWYRAASDVIPKTLRNVIEILGHLQRPSSSLQETGSGDTGKPGLRSRWMGDRGDQGSVPGDSHFFSPFHRAQEVREMLPRLRDTVSFHLKTVQRVLYRI